MLWLNTNPLQSMDLSQALVQTVSSSFFDFVYSSKNFLMMSERVSKARKEIVVVESLLGALENLVISNPISGNSSNNAFVTLLL